MSEQAVNGTPVDSVDDDAPPPGTVIVRPLRHIRAVRERHAQQLAERSLGSEARSARAWSWALGETNVAPVTDRITAVPPHRPDIEREIAIADERRLRGDRENRADAAATVLRWLIGEDDHIPVRGPNRGELVGGFGDVIRSPDQIREMVTTLTARQDPVNAYGIQAQRNDADHLIGVTATLRWVAHKHATAPISGLWTTQMTTRCLKAERVLAEDVIDQHGYQGPGDLPRSYGAGVASAISWLLGDSTTFDSPTG
jgi:hypothetical protein